MKIARVLLLTCLAAPAARSAGPAASPVSNVGAAGPVLQLAPKGAFELIVKHRKAKDLVVIDIRSPEDFAAGHLPGAINMQYDEKKFADEIAKFTKSKSYLLNCAGGKSSFKAAKAMTGQGFKPVYNLDGGIAAWTGYGLPTTK
jgi:rhodanese-related sulfurtransferase